MPTAGSRLLEFAQESGQYQNNASWVIEVSLVVGDLRDVVDELMESCFQFLSRGTIAEGLALSWLRCL